MPQVAARISQDHEKWLKDYFKTKSAGAEFILPWAVDIFFKSIRGVSSDFSVAELKTILEAHRDVKLLPNQSKQAYLLLRVEEACQEHNVHIQHGASKNNLEVKLRRLTDLQATALMIWATAYWTSKVWNGVSVEDYVKLSIA
ncbi:MULTISPECIES: hypothetical protein [Desulfovibrio]|jgi:hypothetical protein|uniref:hypothetical protein n=1 Tax=Desulfovibrio TaxID=872 RepID=UPI00040FB3A9|nr:MULTISPECIES: hypothetical protein [Desulfovibrio]MCM0755796.1 hypothetical protein [Desulfovibrio aminophilus]MDY0305457.1 hypothetical protein [Desulfovibrionaceae bacterium]HMM38452.1 hypothetical protein [Desulfovibrio sp.]